MQNAIISYVLTLAVFMPASGFLADRFGTKSIYIFPDSFQSGILFCAMSQNLTHLVISSVIQGLEEV
jgi:MFS family permease